jgi:hypothetical protein
VLVVELLLEVVVVIVPTGCFSHRIEPGTTGAWRPAYVATNSATTLASCPTTMFWGIICPEKPPFSIA